MAFFHALLEFLSVFDDSGFNHLAEEVVTFPGTLTDSGKNGESVVLLCDIVYQLLDKYGLAYSCATE